MAKCRNRFVTLVNCSSTCIEASSDEAATSRLRGDGVRGVLGIFETGPYSEIDGVFRDGVPEECDVVSALSFVIDKLELCAVTRGASRACVLPSADELVNVRSGLDVDVIA